jgi:hypothetical protein
MEDRIPMILLLEGGIEHAIYVHKEDVEAYTPGAYITGVSALGGIFILNTSRLIFMREASEEEFSSWVENRKKLVALQKAQFDKISSPEGVLESI